MSFLGFCNPGLPGLFLTSTSCHDPISAVSIPCLGNKQFPPVDPFVLIFGFSNDLLSPEMMEL